VTWQRIQLWVEDGTRSRWRLIYVPTTGDPVPEWAGVSEGLSLPKDALRLLQLIADDSHPEASAAFVAQLRADLAGLAETPEATS
jgi:hypothetical protein